MQESNPAATLPLNSSAMLWGDAQMAIDVLVQQAHALGIYAEPVKPAMVPGHERLPTAS